MTILRDDHNHINLFSMNAMENILKDLALDHGTSRHMGEMKHMFLTKTWKLGACLLLKMDIH